MNIDWVALLAAMFSAIAAFSAWYTSCKNNKLTQASLLLNLYKLDEKNKSNLANYKNQFKKLNEWIDEKYENNKALFSFNEFYDELNKIEYKELRKALYFYEYLGSLVKKKQLDFDQVFSVIYFPDEFDRLAQRLYNGIVPKKADFLINYSYLRNRYLEKRREMNV